VAWKKSKNGMNYKTFRAQRTIIVVWNHNLTVKDSVLILGGITWPISLTAETKRCCRRTFSNVEMVDIVE
jgi:hypothetical protein